MAKLKLGVIFGGPSAEHEVSVRSAHQVISALDKTKYTVVPIAITKQRQWLMGKSAELYLQNALPYAAAEGGVTEQVTKSIVPVSAGKFELDVSGRSTKLDLILPIGHGQYIEDGRLQGMLDLLGLPYVFSDHLASALAMDKYKTKLVALAHDIPVAADYLVTRYSTQELAAAEQQLGWPIVVKPVALGSSVGITIAHNQKELAASVKEASQWKSPVLLEQFVQGRELTVAVLGNNPPQALPVIEIKPKVSDFFDYKAKYQAGGSEEICPAPIPDAIRDKVQDLSVRLFQALGCADLSRVDFIWNEQTNNVYMLEINTIPGMTQTSLAPQAAQAVGLSFSAFLDRLIDEALKRLAS